MCLYRYRKSGPVDVLAISRNSKLRDPRPRRPSVEAHQPPHRAYQVCQNCAPAARALVAGIPLSGTDSRPERVVGPAAMPRVGSRVRDAVAGIYESRSLRVKTPSTWAGWTQGTSASTASTKPTSTTGSAAQPAPLGHATVMHVGPECA